MKTKTKKNIKKTLFFCERQAPLGACREPSSYDNHYFQKPHINLQKTSMSLQKNCKKIMSDGKRLVRAERKKQDCYSTVLYLENKLSKRTRFGGVLNTLEIVQDF